MANVSAVVKTSIEISSPYDFTFEFPVVSGDTIYQGSGVVIAASGLLTYATKASALYTAGRAEQTIVGDGVKTCRVRAGIFLFANAGTAVAIDDRFAPCYWQNADAVNLTSASQVLAGLVWDVTADGVYVLMAPHIRA
jgi:hypothetical protein